MSIVIGVYKIYSHLDEPIPLRREFCWACEGVGDIARVSVERSLVLPSLKHHKVLSPHGPCLSMVLTPSELHGEDRYASNHLKGDPDRFDKTLFPQRYARRLATCLLRTIDSEVIKNLRSLHVFLAQNERRIIPSNLYGI